MNDQTLPPDDYTLNAVHTPKVPASPEVRSFAQSSPPASAWNPTPLPNPVLVATFAPISTPDPGPELFIKKREVARRFQTRVRTVDNWMKRRLIPYYKIGRSVTFRWSEIEEQLRDTCLVKRR